jgi:hypothetical protein
MKNLAVELHKKAAHCASQTSQPFSAQAQPAPVLGGAQADLIAIAVLAQQIMLFPAEVLNRARPYPMALFRSIQLRMPDNAALGAEDR